MAHERNGYLRISAGRLIGAGPEPVHKGAILVDPSGKITAAGPDPAVPTPEGATILAFSGSTLAPGLVDCHAHLNMAGDGATIEDMAQLGDDLLLIRSVENARRALATGVTTLRECGSTRQTVFSVKHAVASGLARGPRMQVAGAPITMTGGHCWPFGGEADGVEGVRAMVRRQIKLGADFIKVIGSGGGTANTSPYQASFTVPELKAAADQAHALGRLAAIHATCTEAVVRGLDAGFDMIIHGTLYDAAGRFAFDPSIAARIADQGVWVNPTLHVSRGRLRRLERIATHRPLTPAEEAQLTRERRIYPERSANFQGLLAAGVRVVAGSDAGWSYYPFGEFAAEIDAMAEAGLRPAGAFRAATIDAARALGLDHLVGSLEPGRMADVVVIDGDPTVDPDALQRVRAVFHDGVHVEQLAPWPPVPVAATERAAVPAGAAR